MSLPIEKLSNMSEKVHTDKKENKIVLMYIGNSDCIGCKVIYEEESPDHEVTIPSGFMSCTHAEWFHCVVVLLFSLDENYEP
jgi:hypothetical protein